MLFDLNLNRKSWGRKKYTKRGRHHLLNQRPGLKRLVGGTFTPPASTDFQRGGATPPGVARPYDETPFNAEGKNIRRYRYIWPSYRGKGKLHRLNRVKGAAVAWQEDAA